jgi:phosphate acetyltransferase
MLKCFWSRILNNEIGNYSVGAMQRVTTYYTLKKKSACDYSCDRADIILGALQANESNYPAISGIVLTGNIVPDDSILMLIEGLTSIVPIILSKAVNI